jgi:LytR cell envelope-related transcriptional attenuator
LIFRSLNFWLFLLVVVCGASLWLAKGWGLPFGIHLQERKVEISESWQSEPPERTVHLRILNGTGQSGLAREFSLLVVGQGCVVEGLGNIEGHWPKSLLVNRRLEPEKARELGKRLGNVGVLSQWDERMTEDALLILGEDFGELKEALAF